MNTDQEEIQKIVATVYTAMSAHAGAPRAWDDFASCFAAEARITPFHIEPDGAFYFEVLTVPQYIASRDRLLASVSFFENETEHAAVIEGRIAHVFSRYEARRAPTAPPFVSGVNSVQLVRTPEGWRILSMTWQFTGLEPLTRAHSAGA
jgi:hypothetical protein